MKLVEMEYSPESSIGAQAIYRNAENSGEFKQPIWRSPSITIDRSLIHIFANMDKESIISLLYEEIKIAEIHNLRKLIVAQRADEVDGYRFVRKGHIQGYVYWIKNRKNDLIKIGCSSDIERRLKELKKQYGDYLELVNSIESKSMYLHEYMMHQIFASRRVFGEWFRIEEHHAQIWNHAIKKNWLKRFM